MQSADLSVFLKDHKAETLTRVVNAVEDFAAKNNTPNAKFLLGAGTSRASMRPPIS